MVLNFRVVILNSDLLKISEWGSIFIFINTRGEHNPPHFHAMSAEWEASIRISGLWRENSLPVSGGSGRVGGLAPK